MCELSLVGVAHNAPTFSFTGFADFVISLELSSKFLTLCPRRSVLDMLTLGSNWPIFVHNTVLTPFHTVHEVFYRFLLKYSPFVARSRCVLQRAWVGISRLYVPNRNLWDNTRRHGNKDGACSMLRLAFLSVDTQQNFLRIFSKIRALLLVQTTVFWNRGLLWWRWRGGVWTLTVLYTRKRSVLTSSCGRFRLTSVLTAVTARGSCAITSFL